MITFLSSILYLFLSFFLLTFLFISLILFSISFFIFFLHSVINRNKLCYFMPTSYAFNHSQGFKSCLSVYICFPWYLIYYSFYTWVREYMYKNTCLPMCIWEFIAREFKYAYLRQVFVHLKSINIFEKYFPYKLKKKLFH